MSPSYLCASILRLSLNACAASQVLKASVAINIEAREIRRSYTSLSSWSKFLVYKLLKSARKGFDLRCDTYFVMIDQSSLTLSSELTRSMFSASANKLVMFRLQMIFDIRQCAKASLAIFEAPIGALADVGVLVSSLAMILK